MTNNPNIIFMNYSRCIKWFETYFEQCLTMLNNFNTNILNVKHAALDIGYN